MRKANRIRDSSKELPMFIIRYTFCGHLAIETCRTSEEMRKRIKELLLSDNIDFVGVSRKD